MLDFFVGSSKALATFFTIYDIQYKQNEQLPILHDLYVTLFTQNFNMSVILLLYKKQCWLFPSH